jgi:hypothetical protein
LKTLIIKSILITWLASSCLIAMPQALAAQTPDQYITISGSDCSDTPEGQAAKNTVNLDCKTYHQTTNYTCGPAVLMTVMQFYGLYTSAEMNPKTELHIALEMGATELGTTRTQMTDWLTSKGFNVESGDRIQSDMIIKNLKQNIPTIITVNHHWILAKGFEQATKSSPETISFSDSCCGITVLSSAAIDALWESSALEKMHGSGCTDEGQYIVPRIK